MSRSVLIVDDEKNIRLTLSVAMEKLNIPVDTAASGEEALGLLEKKSYGVLLLDLRLPGLDGMEVLKRASETRPKTKVIVITAYGSIDLAVEAMKLGAVDFLQKPFEPEAVREAVARLLGKEAPEGRGRDYDYYLGLARKRIGKGDFEAAQVYVHTAVFLNPNRPEAYNLLGGLAEARGRRQEADKHYRVALTLDPTYEPARRNLDRVTTRPYTQIGIVWDTLAK